MVAVDVLSKYAWVKPLRNKSAQTDATAFERKNVNVPTVVFLFTYKLIKARNS